MGIASIRVEAWTRDERGAGTDGRIECTIGFAGLPPLVAILDQPGVDNFRRGSKERFELVLDAAHGGASARDVTGIALRNLDADRVWIPGAVGLWVDDRVVLSRVVHAVLPPEVIELPVLHDGRLEGLEVRLRTADVRRAGTDDAVFCTVRLRDGREVASELELADPAFDEHERGREDRYLVPLPDALAGATPADLGEIAIRKDGSTGWLLGGVALVANGEVVFDNPWVNQYLDTAPAVLGVRRWSSARVLGPVLGGAGSTFARVQYRVERPGTYTLRARDRATGAAIRTIEASGKLEPAGVIELDGLAPAHDYDFQLVDAAGEAVGPPGAVTTFPVETAGARGAFAFGSCVRNRYDTVQRCWAHVRRLAHPAASAVPVRFFVHLGDTFYFYDGDVLKAAGSDVEVSGDVGAAARAAHLSSRLHPGFLDAARVLPMVAVWDDHDFRGDDRDSVGFAAAAIARDEFLRYWGNPDLGWRQFGVASRITLGRLDVYLMDGRFRRVAREPHGVMFTAEQCQLVLAELDRRAAALGPRMVGLATGTPWTASDPRLARDPADYEPFANGIYAAERRLLFDGLRARIDSGAIRGLFLLSGDVHAHEVFEVALGDGRVAPELMCSPLTRNAPKSANPLAGERRYSRGVDPSDGLYAGFGVITVDTTADEPNGNWTLRVDYRRHDDGAVFFTHTYTVIDNQLRW